MRSIGLFVVAGLPAAVLFPSHPWIGVEVGLLALIIRYFWSRRPRRIHRNMDLREADIIQRGRNAKPS